MVNNLGNLITDKHIVIAGASSGLGKELAIKASVAGARISLIARDEKRLSETIKQLHNENKHNIYVYDLNNLDGIEQLLKSIVDNCGKIDGYCHCAGITGNVAIRPIKLSTISFVDKILKVHFNAFVEVVRVLSSGKIINKGANIVGISSSVAYHGDCGCSIYAAAKGAIDAYIKSAAIELYSKNIQINNVAFGTINSETFLNMLNDDFSSDQVLGNQKFGAIDLSKAAEMLLFLLSNDSKQYTGNTIKFFAGR